MRNLARLLVPCVVVVWVGCGPPPTCGADLDYNETTGLCDCRTGGTWGDDGYCRYADGAITLRDGAVPMLDASTDDDGGLPDAGPSDAGVDAAPDACVTSAFYRDADGDGHGAATDSVTACVAPDGYVESDDDCNDACETCLPGGTEICSEPALDENCDGTSNEGCACANGTSTSCGATETGECTFGTQLCVDGAYGACEDAVGPTAEVCNGLDDDCDGMIDEGVRTTFYRDADSDGFGNASMSMQACSAPAGYVTSSTDCSDACATCRPGGTEICDGLDNNCAGGIDEGVRATFYRDADSDGYGDASMTMQACSAPAGYVTSSADCNDACATCRPGGTETCDGLDNNCAGGVDEGVRATFYRDADSDGYGNASVTMQACSAPAGYVTSSTDCNDACVTCRPGGTEVCDLLDNDCDGAWDEGVATTYHADCDGDGYAADGAVTTMGCAVPASAPLTCASGGWTTRTPVVGQRDCADTNVNAFPGQTLYYSDRITGEPASTDYDYNCDTVETRFYTRTNVTSCDASCTGGWTGGTVPACGVSAERYTCFWNAVVDRCLMLWTRPDPQLCR